MLTDAYVKKNSLNNAQLVSSRGQIFGSVNTIDQVERLGGGVVCLTCLAV